MQKGKSFKESQGAVLRQVIAQFDIQTQVNKIAVRCFSDLLQQNKQAFEYLNDNQKRMSQLQLRLTKMQGFSASVQTSINSKMEVTHGLSNSLETFNKQFFQAMKQNQHLVQSMRKDYDNVLSSTQKNTHELRSVNQDIKKYQAKVAKMEGTLEQGISDFTCKLGENNNSLQSQIIQVRTSLGELSSAIGDAKAQLSAKGSNFEQVSKDVQLYKHERQATDRRIRDAVGEILTKSNKSDVHQMRLYFDSQRTTDKEYNNEKFSLLSQRITEEIDDRKKEEAKIREDAMRKSIAQDKKNQQFTKLIKQLQSQLKNSDQKNNQKMDRIQKELKVQIQTISKKQVRDVQNLEDEIDKLSKKNTKVEGRTGDIEVFQKKRHEELIQLSSNFIALNDTLNTIIDENEKRKKQLQQLQESNVGDEVSSMSGALQSIKQELIQQRKTNKKLQQSIQDLNRRQDRTSSDLKQKAKHWQDVLSKDRTQNTQKAVEINRRISDVSIQIMKSVQNAERQAKKYADEVRQEMMQKFEMMNQLRKQIQQLKNAFSEQMKQTQKLNKALSQKMQRINAMITKFKSDLIIRIQNTTNELHRRGIQMKESSKILDQLRKHMSLVNQTISIALSAAIARESLQQASLQVVKISSLLQGWVLEVEEKGSRYRGDLINRKKLLMVCLNYFSVQGDKIKGSILENGKDVYIRMMDQQEIFSVRKRGQSKKASQLPKLYY